MREFGGHIARERVLGDTGFGIRDRTLAPTQGGGVDFYLNSAADPGGDGGSPGTAFATVADLASALSNDFSAQRIGVARGSTFFEELGGISDVSESVTINAYGSGRLPIFDCRGVASSWSKTGGQTNVYETTWTPSAATKVAPSIFEDDVRLLRVASVAACDALPGSYYASSVYSNGVAAALYVHATGSGDPASNGKTYKQSVRGSGIRLGGNGCDVRNVRTVGNQHDDGSLVLGGHSGYIENVIAEHGTKHNILLGGGRAKDVVCFKADRTYNVFGGSSAFCFVGYTNDDLAHQLDIDGLKIVLEPGDETGAVTGGFYCHGQDGETAFGNVIVRRLETYYVSGGAAPGNCTSLTIEDSLLYETGVGVSPNAIPTTLRTTEYYRTSILSTYYGIVKENSADSTVTVEDCISYSEQKHAMDFLEETNLTMSRVMLLTANTGSFTGVVARKASALDFSGVLIEGFALNSTSGLWSANVTTSSFIGENNTYSTFNAVNPLLRGEIKLNGTTYESPTDWLAAVQPGNEAGSVATNLKQVTDCANRDYSLTVNASAVAVANYPVGLNLRTIDYAGLVAELEAA